MRIDDETFELLEDHLDFCIDNIRHPDCTLAEAGRFYEEASERLRAHGILRLLIDADAKGFSNDLVMSGHARRGFLRRCARHQHSDYFMARSRSGALFDALAADDAQLAAEVAALSPPAFRRGEEYEDRFCHQRFLGLLLAGAPAADLDAVLDRFENADGDETRLAVDRALRRKNPDGFEEAFAALLDQRKLEILAEREVALEEVHVALDAQVFVEGVAILKLARRLGLPVAREYPLCPALAVAQVGPATPADEFAIPA